MLLKLYDSKLFTEDTAIRFGEQYHVKRKIWNEIWKRALAGYDDEALAGYFIYKTGKMISANSIRRWLIKTEIYCKANHIMLMGVRVVQSEYFGEYERFVLEEVLRNMKYSGTQDCRIMV
jgi:hypothetical protein